MIKAYGLYWKRELVDWNKKELNGTFEYKIRNKEVKKKIKINCWYQRGIYVLYKDDKPIYVGQSSIAKNTSIGKRLNDHRKYHYKDKWNMFSWYGVRKINTNGTLAKLGKSSLFSGHISDLEAIAIKLIGQYTLNKQEENFRKNVVRKVEQNGVIPEDVLSSDLSDRTLFERILQRLWSEGVQKTV